MMNGTKQLWIEALRSGKYEQGQRYLCSDGKYCCLGVACEIYQEHVGDLKIEDDGRSIYYDGFNDHLPIKVAKWFNLVSEYGTSAGSYLNRSLIYLNDRGKTFEEIANILEKNDSYFES